MLDCTLEEAAEHGSACAAEAEQENKAKWEPPFQWGIQDRTSASAKAMVGSISVPPSPFGTDAGAPLPFRHLLKITFIVSTMVSFQARMQVYLRPALSWHARKVLKADL